MEGDDDDDDDDDDHDHDDATNIKNESMLGELRVYVKVVDQKRHFFGPRGGSPISRLRNVVGVRPPRHIPYFTTSSNRWMMMRTDGWMDGSMGHI